MSKLTDILPLFTPITLDEMDQVRLMNRMDQKFLARIDRLEPLLLSAAHSYRILDIGHRRQMNYDSLYFDTADHQMYLQHHNRKLNRHKVRIRQYIDSAEFFLEVKYKNNKGQTRKTRTPVSDYEAVFSPEGSAFVSEKSGFSVDLLEPKLYTTFRRITLVNPERLERVTIDTDLQFSYQNQSFTLPFLAIIELKSERESLPGGFKSILLEQRIFRKKLSKYCTATNLLYPRIRKNRFKPKLLYLKKLENTFHHEYHPEFI